MTNIDNILDELVDPAVETEQPETVPGPDTKVDLPADEDKPEWPKVVEKGDPLWAEYGSPVGTNGEVYVSAGEFATHLLGEGIKRGLIEDPNTDVAMLAKRSQVIPQNVYQASRAKKYPLPSIIIRVVSNVLDEAGNITGTKTDDRQYFPLNEATSVWFNRPTRGDGASGLGDDDVEKRVLLTGKAKARLEAMQRRLENLTAQVNKQQSVYDKRVRLLAEVGKTVEDAVTAYDAWAETQEAGKEIPDDDENGSSNL